MKNVFIKVKNALKKIGSWIFMDPEYKTKYGASSSQTFGAHTKNRKDGIEDVKEKANVTLEEVINRQSNQAQNK